MVSDASFFSTLSSYLLLSSNSYCYCWFSLQGMSMPIAHIEENWQMAEFYSNKVLYENQNPGDKIKE